MYSINVDGGALASQSSLMFGTYTFSIECVHALLKKDSINTYTLYTQKKSISLQLPQIHQKYIWPTIGWMKIGLSLAELFSNKPNSIFLALNQAIPLYTAGPIIGFIHGLSFEQYPKLYPDSYKYMHSQVIELLDRSKHIVVSSEKVKSELIARFGKRDSIHVIPFGIPATFYTKIHKYKRKKIILYVGMNHPIKNITMLLKTFTKLRNKSYFAEYTLVLVGIGNESIDLLQQYQQENIVVISHAKPIELIKLYSEAACLAVPSLYESFHFPTVEALALGTPVVSNELAVIPELAPYVHKTKNTVSDFCRVLENCLTNPKIPQTELLFDTFNWNNFAKKVIALYHE